jgi:hypothetical protein
MKKILIVAAAIVFAVACKKDVSSDANQSDSTLKKYAAIASQALLSVKGEGNSQQIGGGQISRPLKSSGSGTISYIPGGCGEASLQLKSNGTGNSTALGSYTQTTTICLNPATGELLGPVVGVGIAANGDSLNYIFVGQGVDAATGFTYQNYIISGGSGRFANATGNITLLYSVRTPVNFSYTGEGTISY